MLDQVFMQIFDMSKTASIVILVVLTARLFLKKAPKVISYALWAVVLLRLLCPLTIEAPVSIVPEITPVEDTYDLAGAPISFAGAGVAAYQAVGDALNGGLGVQHIPTTQRDSEGNLEYVTADWWDVWILFGQYVWLAGIAAMAVYSAISYRKLKKQLTVTVPLRDNIYIADDICSPFVIGFMRPKIYLPSMLNEKEQQYIIMHEQHHIKRLDHIIKLLAFLALTVHWFNPLVWLAFILAGRDMEMSCDEAVIRKLGAEVRGDYSASLLALATGKRIIAGTPLAFGEGDPKGRIRNLAKWKKPVLWITAVMATLSAVLAICLLTDKTGDDQPNQSTEPTAAATVPQQTQQTEFNVTETEPQLTYPPETTTSVIAGPGADIDFRMGALETKFPFVYDQNSEWLREYLGQFAYIDMSQLKHGAFYVVDKSENELCMLFESGIQILRETPNTVFCVMDGNRLIRSDYYGENVETIYEAAYGTITDAERLDNFMYLLDGGYIVTLDLITYDVLDAYFAEDVDRLCPYSYTMIWWVQSDDEYFLYDMTVGQSQPITEEELNILISRTILNPPTKQLSDKHPTLTISLKSAAITLDGKTVCFLVNMKQLQTIRELFAAAEKCGEEEIPDTVIIGPDLTLTGIDDYVVAGQLAANASLFKIGDIWYKYDTGSGDGQDAVSRLLGLFGLEDWPQWAYDAFKVKGIEISKAN